MEITLSNENFEQEVLNSNIPVLVDFWATWCMPCQMLSPIISELAEEYKDKIKVCKLNVDDNPDLAEKYEVMSIPTLFFFKNGQVINSTVGVISKDNLKNKINNMIDGI